ncbi:guanine nucleotide-binding protein G(f) subunit alpha isoform X1 [Periplaneta americana]|uniref:guanine nucleotide-binding protein G(f) subunit alpha isoform X1 n=2 Tax=Periplaneta americana TaxID=6978 RepID=UPI0037E84AC2
MNRELKQQLHNLEAMGCFGGTDPEVQQQKRVSRELEEKIKAWNKDYKKAVKILLLGTGESGKTTIIKQMKILHISGFSESDRKDKVEEIRQNIHESIYDLVTNMSLLKPPVNLNSDHSEISAAYIRKLGPEEPTSYTQEYYDHVQTLWNDKGVKECYRRSNEFQLIDSAKYFLDRIMEVRNPNYRPSDQDILYSRKKTTGIQKIEFEMKVPRKYGGGSMEFWMFDVGGQRGERRKWLPLFEGINAILFLVASSDFDQTLREDTSTNRLREAVTLFSDVWHSRFLQEAGVIVFLNKQDVLQQKIESGKSIVQYFPEYKKYEMDSRDGNIKDEYLKTRSFIRDLFHEMTKKKRKSAEDRKSSVLPGFTVQLAENDNRQCYFHFTIATDTGNIRTVFEDVHTMILMSILNEFGLQ